MTNKCSRCKKMSEFAINYSTSPTGTKYYHCRECNTERASKYRKTKVGKENIYSAVYKSIKKHQKKQDARILVRLAIESGKLEKLPCEVCGKEKVDGHHEDYNKPLEVNWLCRKHHANLHKLKKLNA